MQLKTLGSEKDAAAVLLAGHYMLPSQFCISSLWRKRRPRSHIPHTRWNKVQDKCLFACIPVPANLSAAHGGVAGIWECTVAEMALVSYCAFLLFWFWVISLTQTHQLLALSSSISGSVPLCAAQLAAEVQEKSKGRVRLVYNCNVNAKGLACVYRLTFVLIISCFQYIESIYRVKIMFL